MSQESWLTFQRQVRAGVFEGTSPASSLVS
jgi:hypothetical protein